MRYFLTIVAVLSLGFMDDGSKLEIDDWEFDWKVAEFGKLRFGVRSTQEESVLYLWDGSRILKFDSKSAYLLADALGDMESYRATLKEDADKIVKCDALKITFRNGKTTGFYAAVSENDELSLRSTFITSKQAKQLIPHLYRGPRMIQMVKKLDVTKVK